MPERVVVTGGSGRVGRYVVRELREDHDVVNADLSVGERAEEHVRCDILDRAALRTTMRGADAVCHLAGLDYDVDAPSGEYLHVNGVGTWNVLEAAAQAGIRRVVVTSSCSVYGLLDSGLSFKPCYLPVDESHDLAPVDGYSVSKLFVEEAGKAWARSGVPSVIALRPLHVVSTETVDDYRSFVASAPRGWLYNYVAAEDVARSFRAALALDDGGFDVFLVGADDTSRPEPTLEWYPELVGPVPEIREAQMYKRSPAASIFSSEKARTVLGWRPTVSFESLCKPR